MENREDDKEEDGDEDEEKHDDEDRQRHEEEDVEEMTLIEEEIKLKKPQPGSKIADLTNIIEAQVHSFLNT